MGRKPVRAYDPKNKHLHHNSTIDLLRQQCRVSRSANLSPLQYRYIYTYIHHSEKYDVIRDIDDFSQS